MRVMFIVCLFWFYYPRYLTFDSNNNNGLSTSCCKNESNSNMHSVDFKYNFISGSES